MEVGTVIQWLVADGTEVRRGQEIVEIETDKATMAYEADADGVLRHLVAAGETLAVGAPIGAIGEDAPSPPSAPEHATPEPAADDIAAARPDAANAPAAATATAVAAPTATRNGGALSASPVARRTAAALGVELASVTGSGPRARILKADVVDAAQARGVQPAATAVVAPAPSVATAATATVAPVPAQDAGAGKGHVDVVELSRLQQTVARRMAESKATIPEFAVSVDVDMGAAVALRAQLKQQVERPPSLNDLLVKACAVTLRRHPKVNGRFHDGRFELFERVNVGVAVAAQDVLIVPTVFDADRASLGAIAQETRRLAERVRDGSITPPELSGGTFTVSNLGMMGVERFAGIVNPGQAAILCAGALSERVVLDGDGAPSARPFMSLTLVSDHRILYGADAAAFLADLRAGLEDPLALLL